GFSTEPLHVARWEPGMPAYDASWNALDETTFPEGVHVCANYTARAGVPGRLRHARRTAETVLEDR
ncbi:MAG: protoporphyrinogen oxidase, partial [Halapricum sp.]